jgi:flagellar motor switch protein FliN/FliY
MSDGSLSQDEIDALLQGAGGMDFDEPAQAGADGLTDSQIKAFAEIVNGATETMGSNLAMLLTKSVSLGAPQADQVNGEMVAASLSDEVVTVTMNLTDGVEGDHGFILNVDTALQIAGPMQGMDGVELDDASLNALQEAFQNVSGPLLTALSDKSGKSVMTDPPVGGSGAKSEMSLSGKYVRLTYPMTIDGQAVGTIVQFFSATAVAAMVPAAAPAGAMGGGAADMGAMPSMGGMDQSAGMGMGMGMGNSGGMQMGGMNMGMGNMGGMPMGNMGGGPSVQGVQFPAFGGPGAGQSEQGNIGLLMDVYMEMTVELGRTKKLIKDILGMGEGTIIELDKLAGEPVDILVNHKLIAKGEVVVIDENFGVRVTEIVSPMERMNTIQ